jgi:hypothetical protein
VFAQTFAAKAVVRPSFSRRFGHLPAKFRCVTVVRTTPRRRNSAYRSIKVRNTCFACVAAVSTCASPAGVSYDHRSWHHPFTARHTITTHAHPVHSQPVRIARTVCLDHNRCCLLMFTQAPHVPVLTPVVPVIAQSMQLGPQLQWCVQHISP